MKLPRPKQQRSSHLLSSSSSKTAWLCRAAETEPWKQQHSLAASLIPHFSPWKHLQEGKCVGKADRVAVFDCWHILLINFFAALPKRSSCPGSELLSAGAAQPRDLCHAFPWPEAPAPPAWSSQGDLKGSGWARPVRCLRGQTEATKGAAWPPTGHSRARGGSRPSSDPAGVTEAGLDAAHPCPDDRSRRSGVGAALTRLHGQGLRAAWGVPSSEVAAAAGTPIY